MTNKIKFKIKKKHTYMEAEEKKRGEVRGRIVAQRRCTAFSLLRTDSGSVLHLRTDPRFREPEGPDVRARGLARLALTAFHARVQHRPVVCTLDADGFVAAMHVVSEEDDVLQGLLRDGFLAWSAGPVDFETVFAPRFFAKQDPPSSPNSSGTGSDTDSDE